MHPQRGPKKADGVSAANIASVSLDKDAFRVTLDVMHYKPEEVEVKVVDNSIIVVAKHEEREDEQSLVSRQLVRKYAIPESVEADEITSSISSDGVLIIQAPLKKQPENNNERKIKIQLTGKPALVPKKEGIKEKVKKEQTKTNTTEDVTIEDAPEENISLNLI